jgi:hypothetical protein
MTQRSMPLLLVLLAVVAGVVAYDRLRPSMPVVPTPEAAGRSQPSSDAQGGAGDSLNPISTLSPEVFDPLFDRPLFTATRAAPDTAESDADPASPGMPDLAPDAPSFPVLLGTITEPQPGGVFLSNPEDGTSAFISPGGIFLEWRLDTFGEGWAELSGPEGTIRITFAAQDEETLGMGPQDP